MENVINLYCGISLELFSQVFSIITGVIAIIAVILAFGYIFRPRIRCTVKRDKNSGGEMQVLVKLFNMNHSKRTLTDIQCQIIAYSSKKSHVMRTLELRKDRIISLQCKCKNIDKPYYLFISETELHKDHDYIKTKFLIPNFLGIKKAYEFEMRLSKITEEESDFIKPKKS